MEFFCLKSPFHLLEMRVKGGLRKRGPGWYDSYLPSFNILWSQPLFWYASGPPFLRTSFCLFNVLKDFLKGPFFSFRNEGQGGIPKERAGVTHTLFQYTNVRKHTELSLPYLLSIRPCRIEEVEVAYGSGRMMGWVPLL